MENTKREFYENGNIKEEYQINESGKHHGTKKLYHENGQLKVEVNWTNGIQDDGEIISYHDNGVKARQVIMLEGCFNGAFTEWHKNGQKKIQGTYKNDKPNIHKECDQDGKLLDFKNIKFNNERIREAVEEWCKDERSALKKYGHINDWNTSEVTDMSNLFLYKSNFNSPIGNWDVSNVINMDSMFYCAHDFNQNIGSWDVSNVNNMDDMFKDAFRFDQDISKWKTDLHPNEEPDLEIYLMYEGALFTYFNDNGDEMTFEAFGLIVECPNDEDYEWEVKNALGELVFTEKKVSEYSYETHLVTDLPEDIEDYDFTNSVGNLHDEALNSIEEAVEFIKNLKTISFKEINPKDGESIRYVD